MEKNCGTCLVRDEDSRKCLLTGLVQKDRDGCPDYDPGADLEETENPTGQGELTTLDEDTALFIKRYNQGAAISKIAKELKRGKKYLYKMRDSLVTEGKIKMRITNVGRKKKPSPQGADSVLDAAADEMAEAVGRARTHDEIVEEPKKVIYSAILELPTVAAIKTDKTFLDCICSMGYTQHEAANVEIASLVPECIIIVHPSHEPIRLTTEGFEFIGTTDASIRETIREEHKNEQAILLGHLSDNSIGLQKRDGTLVIKDGVEITSRTFFKCLSCGNLYFDWPAQEKCCGEKKEDNLHRDNHVFTNKNGIFSMPLSTIKDFMAGANKVIINRKDIILTIDFKRED